MGTGLPVRFVRVGPPVVQQLSLREAWMLTKRYCHLYSTSACGRMEPSSVLVIQTNLQTEARRERLDGSVRLKPALIADSCLFFRHLDGSRKIVGNSITH